MIVFDPIYTANLHTNIYLIFHSTNFIAIKLLVDRAIHVSSLIEILVREIETIKTVLQTIKFLKWIINRNKKH